MHDSKYFTDSNEKILFNSKYFTLEENKNPKPIYYRLQNPKLITNFYISSIDVKHIKLKKCNNWILLEKIAKNLYNYADTQIT